MPCENDTSGGSGGIFGHFLWPARDICVRSWRRTRMAAERRCTATPVTRTCVAAASANAIEAGMRPEINIL